MSKCLCTDPSLSRVSILYGGLANIQYSIIVNQYWIWVTSLLGVYLKCKTNYFSLRLIGLELHYPRKSNIYNMARMSTLRKRGSLGVLRCRYIS